MGSDPKLVRQQGYARPEGPGIYEIHYMGRRMKVHVNRSPAGDLMVYGVPGRLEEGLPLTDFDGFVHPRVDDSRRSATSNLNDYDRASSRMIAGLTALRAAVDVQGADKMEELEVHLNHGLDDEIILMYERVEDRDGVEKAVKERLGVWYVEDKDGIPLPSYGPGAPPEGKDVNGRNV